MKINFTIILTLFASLVLAQEKEEKKEPEIDTTAFYINNEHDLVGEPPFYPGELLEMKARIGWVKAAEATFGVQDTVYQVNQRPTWLIDIQAKTVGIFDLVSSVRDSWGSYYDTASYVPHQFYRYIKEGRFRKNEVLYFDHEKDSVRVEKLHKETKEVERVNMHRTAKNVQDMVSGYYYLRSIDFSKMVIGDIITINTFFDDKLKPMRVKLVEREEIKTKLGKVKAVVLIPILEKDSLFEEDNTVKVWMSDDQNRLPLKLQAKIYVGYLTVEIQNAKNIRHPLALVE